MRDAGAHATCFRRLFNRTAYLGAVEKSRIDCREPPELYGAPNAMPQWLRQGVFRPLEIEFIINSNINDKWQYKWQSAGNAPPFRVGWPR